MPVTTSRKGSLSSLNVIDFGHYYAGPMAAMLLADQGATVIRVVKPGEREVPERQYRLLNRNKKLLTLDLKAEEGKRQALSLIEKTDVVIENFRPGVMKRLGLDYASVKAQNPGLIYLSLPGFSSTDKERAHLQAWEGILAAATGMYRYLSLFRDLLNYPPLYTAIPLCSAYGSINGATAVMAALIARETCGAGTVIEVPLVLSGLLAFSASFIFPAPNFDDLPEEIKKRAYQPQGNRALEEEQIEQSRIATLPFNYKDYVCGDGRRINFSLSGPYVQRFIKILGIDQQLYREGFVHAGEWALGLENNMIGGLSPDRQRRFSELVAAALQTKAAQEWEADFRNAGIACAVLRTRDEWMSIPALSSSGVFSELETDGATLKAPGRLADVSGSDGALLSPQPSSAQSINFVQANDLFARDASEQPTKPKPDSSSQPLKKGDLLKGLKVLDMGNILAAPIAGQVLAEYGADVIKADSSGPGAYYPTLLPVALELNLGKRSILTDTTTAPGREVLKRLVTWADVVTHNILDDIAKRLGVTHEQLQTINPDIVSLQISAYGGSYRGGWEAYSGFDDLLQSASGLKVRMGSLSSPHWHGYTATGDIPCGLSSAFAVLLGVYQQRKTGHAGECRASLARAINYCQLPWMIMENGSCEWGEPHGQFAVGPQGWQRLYECNDGWLYVGTSEQRASDLFNTVTGQTIEKIADFDEALMASAFAEHSCETWLNILNETDIACYPVLSLDEIRNNAVERPVDNEAADEVAHGTLEILRWDDHPCGSPVTLLAPDHVRVGVEQSYRRPTPAPRLGQHTQEILREVGFKDIEIDELIRLRVSHEYYPPLGSTKAFLHLIINKYTRYF